MNLFGNKPEEKAMASLIHDTNSGFSEIRVHLKGLSDWLKSHAEVLKSNNLPIESIPYVRIEYIRSAQKKLEAAIDAYYKKADKEFKADDTVSQGTN